MSNARQLRIVMQALGMYCIVHSSFGVCTAISRLIMWNLPDHVPMQTSIRPVLMESFIYSALLLIPAWILLAKADWCARAVADMSKPRNEEETEDGENERTNDSV